jgi:hypothetical protein
MTDTNNANNIKICDAINSITPCGSDILPLDFDMDEKSKVSKEFGDNTKIDNGIGKGFMQEYTSYKCEYYWDNIKNGLYRRVVDCNSYAKAAYSRTPVVKPFIKSNKVKIDFVTKNCNKNILKYNPFPDEIYTLYEKNINADYDLKNKQTKTGSSKRKHRSNKKNKPVKHYKLLNEQTLNNLDNDGFDEYDDYWDNDYDDYDGYYYNYKTGRYNNRFFDDYSDDDYYNDSYELICRGSYNDSFSRCFGSCCN